MLPWHDRRNPRTPGRDYSAVGAYFITVCTEGRLELFGEIIDGEMRLNDAGNAVAESWRWLESQIPARDVG